MYPSVYKTPDKMAILMTIKTFFPEGIMQTTLS